MMTNDRIAARTLQVGSGMWDADGPLKPVSRLDEHLAERFAEADETIAEGFRFYEQLVDQLVRPEQREWVLEEISRQHDFARREGRRLSVAVELNLDASSIGAQMTRNLVSAMRVHSKLQRLARSAYRATYRLWGESEIDELVALHRAAVRQRRAQVRRQSTRVLQAIALFHLLRIAIFGVVTAVAAQLINNAFPASLGWWGLVAGSSIGYSVTRYLVVPVLSGRFDGLMLKTTLELLVEIINVCRSNAATYFTIAQTLGDLGAAGPASDEPVDDSLG